MRVPVQVQIGGKPIRIEYVDEILDTDGSHLSGELICMEHRIRVSKARHHTEREVFRTLYHELTHAAFEITGHSAVWTDAQEEPLVYALEAMMADLFVFMPGAPIKFKEIAWPGEDE